MSSSAIGEGLTKKVEGSFTSILTFISGHFPISSLMLCIYLEINTNYVYPCRGLVPSVKDRNHLCRGPEFPLSGTGIPPEGLVMSFQYMQLYLTLCLILFEGLVDEYCQSIQALKSILVSLVS